MKQILVYSDSLSWGIIPGTRRRLNLNDRWPGFMEIALNKTGQTNSGLPRVRVIENCLNGRRTVWEDPFKPGRNGLAGLQQAIEINSPLELVLLMLGTNDFQSVHQLNAGHAAAGIRTLVAAIRQAPIEPGMPVPGIMIVAPPPIVEPKGPFVDKFREADIKSAGLADEYEAVARELDCHFFRSGDVTPASSVDGIHLDKDQHHLLGQAIAAEVEKVLGSGVG